MVVYIKIQVLTKKILHYLVITFCGQSGLDNVKTTIDLTQLNEYVDLKNILNYNYTVWNGNKN